VRGGDSPREGGLPAIGTRDLETAQSEGDVVATQLDSLAREQEENEGSSMDLRQRAANRYQGCIVFS
jgi:hypothetical protein